ncbi:unnamed protein product [Rotaria magnacalcarata]|uniref:NAD(+)--protein-arginine ADP-ribosyltransferase n=2 Tax=Rotaria magnacalcarata TaxID=392030 RepID=A0A819F5C9_9BILA|nr:unnamed protein product [Rotaria magnacalcarata]
MGACNRKQELFKQDSVHRIQYEILKSTDGYDKIPIVSLEQAVLPLVHFLPQIQTYVHLIKHKCANPADGLTPDESASIMLYSIGWQPLDECLYVVLNSTLQSMNQHSLKPWLLYLKLLFTAVLHLPSIHLTVYRHSKSALMKQYDEDEIIVWWEFSLCTTSIEPFKSEQCSDKIETRTLFTIECNTIKDIRKHTYFQSDNSLLILPGTQFKVILSIEQDLNLHLITLQEIQSSFLLQTETPAIKPRNSFKKLFSCKKESKKLGTSHKTSISNGSYRNTSIEQLIVESGRSWTVDLDEQHITDQDIKIVVKHAIIKNRCKRIRLRDNHITSLGALTLAEGLNNNMVLESLDLRNNYVSDLGVKYLALSIINSNLKTLNLESNGITTEGAQYLAEMLKNNQTLTELYLSKNHLGDRGVKWLTNVLNHDKKNYQDQEYNGSTTVFAEFSCGRDHFKDKPGTSRSKTAVTPESIGTVRELVNIDPHITCQQIEDTLQIGSAPIDIIVHDYLGLKKVTYRWVPHSLSAAQEHDRVDYCLQILEKFDGGKLKRVYDIITGGERWFYDYDSKTKHHSQIWMASNDSHPTKSGFTTSIPLENVLKQVEKHRRLNGLLIHHDNAPAHGAALTMGCLDT